MVERTCSIFTVERSANPLGLSDSSIRPPTPALPPPHLDAAPIDRLADLKFLALLVLLTIGLRAWQLTHTEVAARDSIGYIRVAWELEHGDWPTVIRTAQQHPAYPVAVRAMSVPVRYFVADLARAMQLSAQLTSALASVLLVVPLYYLGREMFARNIAFWGVLLFQCLPSPGRVMADGLSEPLFLLFAASSLALALAALRTQSLTGFALAGLASGAAYLTRPEGGLLAAATGLVLLAQQLRSRWRRPWPVALKCGAALSVGTMCVAGPFMVLIRDVTLKQTAKGVLNSTGAESLGAPWLRSSQDAAPAPTRQLLAMWWDKSSVVMNDLNGPAARRVWGAKVVGQCLARGLFFIGVVPALIGLWVFRDRFRLLPGAAVLVLLGAVLLFALYRVAVLSGYLSDRHTMLITMCACPWVAAGTVVLGRWFAAWDRRPGAAGAWTTGLLVLGCLGPALKTAAPLHSERAGFREAGYWLAQNTQPGDRLVDPYTWASYYAGRVFQDSAPQPAHQSAVCYVVVDETENKHSHLDEVDQAHQLAKTGREVRRWNLKRGEVAIYAVTEPNTR